MSDNPRSRQSPNQWRRAEARTRGGVGDQTPAKDGGDDRCPECRDDPLPCLNCLTEVGDDE